MHLCDTRVLPLKIFKRPHNLFIFADSFNISSKNGSQKFRFSNSQYPSYKSVTLRFGTTDPDMLGKYRIILNQFSDDFNQVIIFIDLNLSIQLFLFTPTNSFRRAFFLFNNLGSNLFL
jgi:hypothetical protein